MISLISVYFNIKLLRLLIISTTNNNNNNNNNNNHFRSDSPYYQFGYVVNDI
jgi:hypothetical protein